MTKLTKVRVYSCIDCTFTDNLQGLQGMRDLEMDQPVLANGHYPLSGSKQHMCLKMWENHTVEIITMGYHDNVN